MRGPLLLLLLAISLLLGACGDRPATGGSVASRTLTPGVTADPELAARSQAVLDGVVKADEPGCSAAVGREGNVVWTGARGVANMEAGATISAGTVFDIASVSKQFTATAILLLADAGRLSIDDPLSRYVHGLPAWADTVTVTQLIHHTSGIPDYTGLLQDAGYEYSDRTTQAQAVAALKTVQALSFEPGTKFEYSNSNYLLLGEIVQEVSGQPLPKFLAAEIFQPLALAMTMDPTTKDPNKAVSYEAGTAGISVADSPWEQIGDGAIQTTPTQLVRWADNYRTGKVGGRKLLEAQLAGAVDTDENRDKYAAGIYVSATGALEHDGSWAGFVTDFRISEDRRTAVAVSCNTSAQDPVAIVDKLAEVWM